MSALDYNPDALRPLYRPWEEPNKHRKRNPQGGPALTEPGRRSSKALLVPRLRHEVDMWRHNGYIGASDTTRTLLYHWFETAHEGDFKYHFCQREAIETVIWLYEVAGYRNLSAMYSSLFGEEADDTLLQSITPEEDAWARYCSKLATGAGKTKCMSLAVVWSYFHRAFEANSDLAQHFVVIAPNLIVFERLKDDFCPGEDGKRIFERDPLVPPEWKDDFHLQVILQDETGGAAVSGALYLTNIHRLYERDKKTTSSQQPPSWAGPNVSTTQALKTGEELRKRITSHPTIMVLNDEAHHLHDPDSAWNEALEALHKQCLARGNAGICSQLDYTATPKHNSGALFRHVVCDFPLGEAVDAGIVKVPVIGRSDELKPMLSDNAAQRYRLHLKLGYKQYEYAYAEWKETRKPILFIMTEDTTAANDIAATLDSDEYPLLKGRVVNLHTKLKGKIKKKKQGGKEILEFVEDEKAISDDDLKAIRQISRDLDKPHSPYRCVVSVLMLREGWDVRNVTTIVPLRPYSADSNILAEQTLGRGLRRMTGPGEAPERVTVVEHTAFSQLYEEELAEEGLPITTTVLNGPRPTTVSIFVDPKKPVDTLEIEIPVVTDAIRTTASIDGLTFEEVRDFFKARQYRPLPVLKPRSGSITFEERSLFTDELVATWDIDRGLLSMGFTAISVFVKELEKVCRLQGAHSILAPILQKFVEEVLFERPVSLFDGSVDHRMANADVAEHIRATFTPLIRKKTIWKEDRKREKASVKLSTWKPYQASMTPLRPCVTANRTMFNLVPCGNDLEAQFVEFCDVADDVAALARNGGPQKLMIDYMAPNGRPALYVPDFIVRMKNGDYYLVELKGQEDTAVPLKARAAVEWCKTASTKDAKWHYLFVPMVLFEAANEFLLHDLARACAPRLKGLLDSLKSQQLELSLELTPTEIKQERTDQALQDAGVPDLPDDIRVYVTQAVNQLAFDRKKGYPQFGGAFQPLLVPFEQLCGELLQKRLGPHVPTDHQARQYYFDPFLGDQTPPVRAVLTKNQRNLQKNLVHGANCNRIGTLLFCLEFADNWNKDLGAVWQDVRDVFSAPELRALYPVIDAMNRFRNKHVAHVDEPLTDGDLAETTMKQWVGGIAKLCRVIRD